MAEFTILRDTREQKPYPFHDYDVDVKDEKLDTGDYTVEGYKGDFAVERKTKPDFLRSMTHDRDRFKRELVRAGEFNFPMALLLESPRVEFERGMYRSEAHPNSVIGTIDSWGEKYNVNFFFKRGRGMGEETAYTTLLNWVIRSE